MVAPIRSLDAEGFSYKIIAGLEGSPSHWRSSEASEARRMEAAKQLETWFRAHAASPDTPEAYDAYDQLVPAIATLYARHGATKGNPVFDKRAELIGDTIQKLIGEPTLDALLLKPKPPATELTAPVKRKGILGQLADKAKKTWEDEGKWYKRKIPIVVHAVEKSLKTGKKLIGEVSDTAKKAWEDEGKWYAENIPVIVDIAEKGVHTVAQKAEILLEKERAFYAEKFPGAGRDLRKGALIIASSIGAQITPLIHRLSNDPQVEISQDMPAMTRWAIQYSNYFQTRMNAYAETGHAAKVTQEGDTHLVGYGTEIDSNPARHLLNELRINRWELMRGDFALTEIDAELLLHFEAERFANEGLKHPLSHEDKMAVMENIHRENKLLIAEIDGLPDQKFYTLEESRAHHAREKSAEKHPKKNTQSQEESGEKKPDKEGHKAPKDTPSSSKHVTASHEKKTLPQKKHALGDKSHADKKLSSKHAKKNHTKPVLKKGTKLVVVEPGLSSNPNDYMSRALGEKILEALKDVPQVRDYGNPNDAGSKKFYAVEAMSLDAAEGKSSTMYPCSEGHPTIGYGCNLDVPENRSLIKKLFGDRYDPQAMREGRQEFDLKDAKILLYDMLAKKELAVIERTGGIDCYRKHSTNLQWMTNDLYFNGPKTIGKHFIAAWKADDTERLIDIVNNETNGNDDAILGKRRTFVAAVGSENLELLPEDKQAARLLKRTFTKEIPRMQSKGTKELIVSFDTENVDAVLDRFKNSKPIKNFLKNGKELTVAANGDTLAAKIDDGEVEWVRREELRKTVPETSVDMIP